MTNIVLDPKPVRLGLAISDLHIPRHDGDKLDSFVELVQDIRPDLIVLAGDLIECEALNTHRDHNRPHDSLYQEFSKLASVLKRIRAAAPRRCRLEILDGNHEYRMTRGLVASDLAELVLAENHQELREELARWRRHTYKPETIFVAGGVAFLHGQALGKLGDAKDAVRVWNCLSQHGFVLDDLVVARGHTHNRTPFGGGGPISVEVHGYRMPVRFVNMGTFSKGPDWDYRGDLSGWVPGVLSWTGSPADPLSNGRTYLAPPKMIELIAL